MKLFIGTPCARDVVFTAHHLAVAHTMYLLGQKGIGFKIHTVQGYDISEQRDRIATEFLKSDATHLLLWDDDVSCDGNLPLKLLSFEKELVAAVYPIRRIDVRHFAALNVVWPPTHGELTEADAVGAGMLLIARSVFERFLTQTTVREYLTHGDRFLVKEFFHRGQKPDGEKVPEDWSFCLRYKKLGGTVWVYPFAKMSHHGHHTYSDCLADVLKGSSAS